MGWDRMPQPTREFSPTHFLSFLELKWSFTICKMLWQDVSKLNPMLGLRELSGSAMENFYSGLGCLHVLLCPSPHL